MFFLRFFQRLSITAKFNLLSIFALVMMGAGTVSSLYQYYQLDINNQKSTILAVDKIAQSVAEHYVNLAKSGVMTTPEAQKAALAAIGDIRYRDNNYVFVMSDDGTVLSEADPSLDGRNLYNYPDARGKVFFPAMLDAAMAGKIFFQHYYFPSADGGPAQPKISAMVGVPQWGWALGTGVYVDHVLRGITPYIESLLPIFLPFILLYLFAIFATARHIFKMLQNLSRTMQELSAGHLTVNIPYMDRYDQIGSMASTLRSFKDAALEKNRLEAEAEASRQAQERSQKEQAAQAQQQASEQNTVVCTLGDGLNRLANGDLSTALQASFPPAYEQLRQDFNLALSHLKETLYAIEHSASSVSTGTDEIMQATDNLSKRTEQQAAALEETAAALGSVADTVKQTASNTSEALKVVNSTHASASHSGKIMNEAVRAMGEIEKSSHQIGNIIGVIDEIAFQTNLLALNAGVEAARAGDAGRGFAVVATEVRALAQRSAAAAKEIKDLISTSGTQVVVGVKLVSETGEALEKIAGKVGQLNEMIQNIAESANIQATGLSEVSAAVNQMDQMTQQNAAMVEETTAASHSLSSEAQGLEKLIQKFDIERSKAPLPKQSEPTSTPITQLRELAHIPVKPSGTFRKIEQKDESWNEF